MSQYSSTLVNHCQFQMRFFKREWTSLLNKANTSNKLQHFTTVSIRGIISVHIALGDCSPNTLAEHQLRLVKIYRIKIGKYMNGFITVRYMICSSGNQKTTSSPVSGVSGVPDGVGAQEGQLAAVLCHAADLVHLQAVAQLGEDGSVPCIHNTPGPDF